MEFPKKYVDMLRKIFESDKKFYLQDILNLNLTKEEIVNTLNTLQSIGIIRISMF